MPFSKEDLHMIKGLRESKNYSSRQFLREFPEKHWTRSGLDKLLKKISVTGSVDRVIGSGRRRSSRTEENVGLVGDLILSQEDAPNTHRSTRQISRETGIHRSSVVRIIHKDLQLKCLKKKPAHELTEANRLTRLDRSRQLLRKYTRHMVDFIFFTDEKLFTVARPSNTQNDRLYVTRATKKKQVAANRLLRTRTHFNKSVMVSVAVSTLGRSHLVFIDPGVKINGAYYRDVLLSQHLLPVIRNLAPEGFFVFQQDSAPAHRARETIEMLARETPDFIPPTLWPPNSPDLNPVDYKVWSVMQERVYQTAIHDVNDLKQRLLEVWAALDQRIIDNAVAQWRQRLQACVQAEGGHFEHLL